MKFEENITNKGSLKSKNPIDENLFKQSNSYFWYKYKQFTKVVGGYNLCEFFIEFISEYLSMWEQFVVFPRKTPFFLILMIITVAEGKIMMKTEDYNWVPLCRITYEKLCIKFSKNANLNTGEIFKYKQNNFMIFQLQNYLQIFAIFTYFEIKIENTFLINLIHKIVCISSSSYDDECFDFTMVCFFFFCVSMYSISRRNNASISNFGGGFRRKREYLWCIIKVKTFSNSFQKKSRKTKKKKRTEKREFLRKTSFRPNRFLFRLAFSLFPHKHNFLLLAFEVQILTKIRIIHKKICITYNIYKRT
ncbi:Uncharacterized protein FWK35_00013933 [Aphis craccivora]|uniref:Uncharacterized protein n=1 Tax=Aphis craccivora TaxID=307492 RepID=A0A6G0YBI5_APHCR|nr:Uncharacterized protein FWK35_00013933 [Aphis craccivora]